MTKQELLSTPAFQNARDDAFIYFVAWFDGGSWIRHVTVPKKEDQTRDCIRFRSFEPLIRKYVCWQIFLFVIPGEIKF